MTHTDGAYRHLILAVTDFSRGELRALASQHGDDHPPSEALVDDLRRTLAGHTQIGRSIPLTTVLLGAIPRDPETTRIARPLLTWMRQNPAA
jgi:hypothetical protein